MKQKASSYTIRLVLRNLFFGLGVSSLIISVVTFLYLFLILPYFTGVSELFGLALLVGILNHYSLILVLIISGVCSFSKNDLFAILPMKLVTVPLISIAVIFTLYMQIASNYEIVRKQIDAVALALNNPHVCTIENILTSYGQANNICLEQIAIKRRDISLCPPPFLGTSSCVNTIAALEQNSSLCEVLKGKDYNGDSSIYNCYEHVAEQTKDMTLCDKLENEFSVNYCKKQIQQDTH